MTAERTCNPDLIPTSLRLPSHLMADLDRLCDEHGIGRRVDLITRGLAWFVEQLDAGMPLPPKVRPRVVELDPLGPGEHRDDPDDGTPAAPHPPRWMGSCWLMRTAQHYSLADALADMGQHVPGGTVVIVGQRVTGYPAGVVVHPGKGRAYPVPP